MSVLHRCLCLILGLSLLGGCDLLKPLPDGRKPTPAPNVETSPNPELTHAVQQVLLDTDATDEELTRYYGLFATLAVAVQQPELKKSKELDEVTAYSNKLLGITPKKYAQFSKVAGDALDALVGTPGAAKNVDLTPELRTKFAETYKAIALGCKAAM